MNWFKADDQETPIVGKPEKVRKLPKPVAVTDKGLYKLDVSLLGKDGETVEEIAKRVQKFTKTYLVALYARKMKLCNPPVLVDAATLERTSKGNIVDEFLMPMVRRSLIHPVCRRELIILFYRETEQNYV